MPGRLAKIVMCLALAFFALLVAYDNVVDYGTNYAFVQHVLGMDTIFADSDLKWRAITSPTLWRIAYAAIMLVEAATGVLFLAGAVALWRARHADASTFNAAKRWIHAAAALGFLVWYLGFEVIGGEWFAMWQSSHWNGEQAAFRMLMVILAVLIFVNQPDPELPPPRDAA